MIPHTVPVADVPRCVANFALENHLPIKVKDPDEVPVAKLVLPQRLKEMQELAQKRGGRCLSSDYVNNSTPLKWECGKGHTWQAVPGSLQQGRWCPKCVGRLKGDEALQQLQSIASAKGGECLAEKYEHGSVKLLWRCAEGHEWQAAAQYIRRGSWCHECAKKIQGPKRMGLAACKAAAIARGGQCLSNSYVNTDTKLLWKCGDCSHIWQSTPYSVVRLGTWCPKCKGKRAWATRRNREGKESELSEH